MTTNCKVVGQPRLNKAKQTNKKPKPSKKKIQTEFIVKNKNLEPRIYRLA